MSTPQTQTSKDLAVENAERQAGYSRALFVDDKERWNDDRMTVDEETETRYHDRDNVIKVANGLCHDIFFRAEDIHHEEYQDFPDAFAPALEAPNAPNKTPHRHKKPLDSRNRERTYILNPDEVEQQEVKRPVRKRKPNRSRSRARSRKPRRRR